MSWLCVRKPGGGVWQVRILLTVFPYKTNKEENPSVSESLNWNSSPGHGKEKNRKKGCEQEMSRPLDEEAKRFFLNNAVVVAQIDLNAIDDIKKFVVFATKVDVPVMLRKGDTIVDAASLMGVLSLSNYTPVDLVTTPKHAAELKAELDAFYQK